MKMLELLYEGKAKKIFQTDQPGILAMEYKDSLTAFNAQKTGQFQGKGELNCKISTLFFTEFKKLGINSHWLETFDKKYMKVCKTQIIPLEVVVRNYAAGSLAKKLGLSEGLELRQAIVEFYYKNDSLNDPFVNDEQAIALGWATQTELDYLKNEALKINKILQKICLSAGLKLVDFKIEFGRLDDGQIVLADEISPDCMRLWDMSSGKKMDKDRFRQDLGGIDEAYQEVFKRLTEVLK